MQRTWIRSIVQEDAHDAEQLSPCDRTIEPMWPTAHALKQEKPLKEAWAPHLSIAHLEKACKQQRRATAKTQHSPKKNFFLKKN